MPSLVDVYTLPGVFINTVDDQHVDSVVEVSPDEILTDVELTEDTYIRVDFVDSGIESLFFSLHAEIVPDPHYAGYFNVKDIHGQTQSLEIGRFTSIDLSELA